MKRRDVILFDLDGTLTDPGEGITRSVAFALDGFGIAVSDRRTLYPFIGPPLADSFMRFYGFSKEQAEEAIARYRIYFASRGLFENEVYPGIPELLERLGAQGLTIAVATSKPAVFARRILEHFGLSRFFHGIYGSELDGTRVNKADVIRFALSELGVSEPDRALMVGDREHDVIGARSCGLDCLGVLYGYGSRTELENAGAVAIAETVSGIGDYLICRE